MILIDESTGDAEKLQWDQIRLVRIREEYHRFSKAAGLPEQYERMETAEFTWKHGKAAEKAANPIPRAKTTRSRTSQKKKKLDDMNFTTFNITKADSIRPQSIIK